MEQKDENLILELTEYASCAGGFELPPNFPKERLDDKEFMMRAVKTYGANLCFASQRLRDDEELGFEALAQNGWFFEFLSKRLKHDDRFILSAIGSDKPYGMALAFASDEMKNDKEVVLKAISGYMYALEYASDALKDDKEVVIAALSRDGGNIKFVSSRLCADREIIQKAVEDCGGYALKFASEELKKDPELIKIAREWDDNNIPF